MDSPADLDTFITDDEVVNSVSTFLYFFSTAGIDDFQAVEHILSAIIREERSMVITGKIWLDRYEKRD